MCSVLYFFYKSFKFLFDCVQVVIKNRFEVGWVVYEEFYGNLYIVVGYVSFGVFYVVVYFVVGLYYFQFFLYVFDGLDVRKNYVEKFVVIFIYFNEISMVVVGKLNIIIVINGV